MSSWGPSTQMNATRQLPNTPRILPTSLFHHMERLLDNGRHHVHFEDTTNSRRRDPIINRPIEQYERQEDLIDIDFVLASCVKETYVPNYLSRGDFNKNHQEECSICLEKFEVDERLLRLPCNHLFHIDCVLPWIASNHDKCPICRAKIVPIVRKNQKYSNVPLGNANNGPQSDMYPTGEFYTTSRNTSTKSPIHIINVHLNADVPPRVSNVPHQIANLHSLRLVPSNSGAPPSRVSTNPYSTSAENNHFNVPTNSTYKPTIRDIPIAYRRQPYGYGASVREIPISHHRPHHPQNLLSRGGYTRRHGSNDLADFENEEAPSAILARLNLWI